MTPDRADPVRLQRDGDVARITLSRPDRLNTIDLAVARRLREVAQVCADDGVRVVLLDGSGANFCAGGDLKEFAPLGERLGAHLREVTVHLHAAMTTFARLDAPLVVAARGAVAGAGLGLACAGDIVLASDTARFTFAYGAIGLSPDGGTSWVLPRLVGPRLALSLALENRQLDAQEAAEAGLVTRVLPDAELDTAAASLAARLAEGPTQAYGATRRLLRTAWDRSYDEQLVAEAEALIVSAGTSDGLEGVTAFVARRTPGFRGR